MKVLALDISTKTGYAVLEGEVNQIPQLKSFGKIETHQKVFDYGGYPFSFLFAAEDIVGRVMQLILDTKPDVIVVEETNLGTFSRYKQKILEFLHCSFLRAFHTTFVENHHANGVKPEVYYISSAMWRSAIGLQMTKEDKKNNALLSKAKKLSVETGKSLDKGSLGIKGKINKKHLSVRYINTNFGKDFKMKDNDITDGICLGVGFFLGAKVCDGVM